jgi:bacillithiol biosynthesis cysteine-adding enzyme BshC
VPVVPVFWVDGDDHDWDEVRAVHVLDAAYAVASTAADDPPGAGTRSVGSLLFDARIADTVSALGATLAPTEFTTAVVDLLRKHYRPGVSPAAACAGWLDELLGAQGLVVFDASDSAAKRLAAAVFQREFAQPCRTARLAREAGERMAAAGHAAQIVPGDDVVCLFRIDEAGRLPIRCRDGRFTVNDEDADVETLVAEAASHPERFSPNVLLRPIVQDTLFPTVCYVAGPSELAYHAQLDGVYRAFGVERPLVACRASASVIDSAAARFLDRYDVAFESLQTQDESALNRLLESQLPPSLDAAFDDVERQIGEWTERLKAAAAVVDPTLVGAADSTATRMRETVKNLQGKIVQAAKKKDETVRRQFIRTQALLFPNGHPQERFLNVAFFINRYGPEFGARLVDALPSAADRHYIVVP